MTRHWEKRNQQTTTRTTTKLTVATFELLAAVWLAVAELVNNNNNNRKSHEIGKSETINNFSSKKLRYKPGVSWVNLLAIEGHSKPT